MSPYCYSPDKQIPAMSWREHAIVGLNGDGTWIVLHQRVEQEICSTLYSSPLKLHSACEHVAAIKHIILTPNQLDIALNP